jgi:hypothetical protein
MTERQPQPDWSPEETARSEPPWSDEVPAEQTSPLPPVPVPEAGEAEPTILGFPAEFAEVDDGERPAAEPDTGVIAGGTGSPGLPAVLRRADRFGGLALVLAGLAAAMSLLLPWRRENGATGLSLVRRGIAVFGSGIGELGRSGLWQPLAVVLGGGVLLLLGLLLFLRARTHRFVGVLALLVAVAAAAGVLVPLAAANWDTAPFDLGMWFAVAVAGLGVVGAMKAMLTIPLLRTLPRWPGGAGLGLSTSRLRSP